MSFDDAVAAEAPAAAVSTEAVSAGAVSGATVSPAAGSRASVSMAPTVESTPAASSADVVSVADPSVFERIHGELLGSIVFDQVDVHPGTANQRHGGQDDPADDEAAPPTPAGLLIIWSHATA